MISFKLTRIRNINNLILKMHDLCNAGEFIKYILKKLTETSDKYSNMETI